MSDNLGKKWEQSFHEQDAAYEYNSVDKNFFEAYQQSQYVQLMLKYAKLKKGDRVLEAGCGSGKLSVVLATMGYQVTAMDFSKTMLKNVLNLKNQAENHFGKIDLEAVQGDLGDLKLKDKYKLVFNEGVVEHWLNRPDRVHVIAQMKKVTSKGGTVAIFVPNAANPLHFWWVVSRFSGYTSAPKMTRYSTGKLKREMKEAGLKKLQSDGIDVYYTFNKWPHLPLVDFPLGYLEKHYRPAKAVREWLGTNIVGLGTNI